MTYKVFPRSFKIAVAVLVAIVGCISIFRFVEQHPRLARVWCLRDELFAPLVSPTSRNHKPIDVFLIIGQSNAAGNTLAEDASINSPVPQTGTAYKYSCGAIRPSVNPLGYENSGGPWPAFAIEYHRKTGRDIAFIPAANGGSGLLPNSDDGNGNWSVKGNLFHRSVERLGAGIAAFRSHGFAPKFQGILISQGESDGGAINLRRESPADYKSALALLFSRYRVHFRNDLPIYIFVTGTEGNLPDRGFAAVRKAQEEIAKSLPNTYIVFRGALSFQRRQGFINRDRTHYTQRGYNEMGRVGARNTVQFIRRLPRT